MNSMANAFNHRILKKDDLTKHGVSPKNVISFLHSHNVPCACFHCENKPLFICAYNYIVKGQQVCCAENVYCYEHTKSFAKKYGIQFNGRKN